jgi:DNA-binding protein WhiA
MSFSKDVKNYLKEITSGATSCCKKAFQCGSDGIKPQFRCQKCQGFYAAGAFCASGTMSDPEKSFQLFIYTTEEAEEVLLEILSESVFANSGTSKGKRCVYFKGSENVGGFLAFCKATPFAMNVFHISIEKEEKMRVQRECNAEVANMVRAFQAAAEQLDAIRVLKKYNMLDNLKKELKDAALLREENPEAGLSELVALSPEPVSKSGLNYRLKKLVSLAHDVEAEESL